MKGGASQTANGFGPGKKTKDEADSIISDLSRQNAILRRKLDDALQKLDSK